MLLEGEGGREGMSGFLNDGVGVEGENGGRGEGWEGGRGG